MEGVLIFHMLVLYIYKPTVTPSTVTINMSNYEKFLVFEEISKQWLSDDLIRMVRKAMNFTRADLAERFDELKIEIAGTEMDKQEYFYHLREKIDDAKRHAAIVRTIRGEDSESYRNSLRMLDAAQQKLQEARAEFRAEIQRLKQQARAVREEYLLLNA